MSIPTRWSGLIKAGVESIRPAPSIMMLLALGWPLGPWGQLGCHRWDLEDGNGEGGAGGQRLASSADTTSGSGGTGHEGGAGGAAGGEASEGGAAGGEGGAGGSTGVGGGGEGLLEIVFSTSLTSTSLLGDLAGGTPFADQCPAGQAVVGLAGYLDEEGPGAWIGKLRVICGAIGLSKAPSGSYAVTIGAGATLPIRGGTGTFSWTRVCPNNQVIVGFSGRSGRLVDQIVARCAELLVTGSAGAYALDIGPITDLPSAGGDGGQAFPTTDCPAGDVALLSNIRAGTYVDAFGIGCSTPSLVSSAASRGLP